MDCPTCHSELERDSYEGQPLFQCGTCSGYFVELNRFKIIRSKRDVDLESLKEQASAAPNIDNVDQIDCPRCRIKMQKERIGSKQSPVHFMIDKCNQCDHVWFDGGELAQAQLKYEASAQAVEEFRRRLALTQSTGQRKTEFKTNLQRLGDSIGAPQIAGFSVLLIALFFGTIALKALGFGLASAVTCFLLSLGLATIALLMIDGTIEERAVAGGIVIAGIAASIGLIVL